MDDGGWWSYFIIIFLLFMSAYFSMAETAYASVNRIKLKTAFEKGDRRAKKAMHIIDNFDRTITTILIGTNIVNITVAAMITVIVTNRYGVSAVTISTIVTTLVVFFVGEMLPKSIGKKYSLRFSLAFSSSMSIFMTVFTPLSIMLTSIGGAVAKLTKGDSKVTVTEDELYDIIENMKDDGDLDEEKGELVHSALKFADVPVENIVTSRVDMKAIDINVQPSKIVKIIKSENHSRFPVYRDSIDNIVGVLQIRKFIKEYIKKGDELDVASVLDDVYFAHQSTKINELLAIMSHRRLNMAVVTDNHGGTFGIVTVEDILEELVGEIWDEDDEVTETLIKLTDNSYSVDPDVTIEEAFEEIDFKDPDDYDFDNKQLGEWIYETFDHIPTEGDKFIYNGLEIAVVEMSHNRIVRVSITVSNEETDIGGHE